MRHLVYLTAGAAGMFCGSCMHDNALARAIQSAGKWDVTLVPTYTPIRTDEEDVSVDQVFFGGINVYLQQKLPLLRWMPNILDRWLDQPWLIRRLTAKASDTSPKFLGQLAVSMLKGRHGNQRKEVRRLIDWLKREAKPDAIILTNVLIGGCIEDLKNELKVPVLATLQGDDAFLDILPAPYAKQATALASQVANRCDGLLVHSECYAKYMSQYLNVPRQKMHLMRLGIDTEASANVLPRASTSEGMTLGYLARLAPEKGIHRLIEAFLMLKQQPEFQRLKLRVAGWLGEHRREWFLSEWQKIADAGFGDDATYTIDLDRAGKLQFLNEIDLLCVPTQHVEPKGLFVLEAIAVGVPVVVPAAGAFPELLASTGGGRLCLPDPATNPAVSADIDSLSPRPVSLEATLRELLLDPQKLREMGQAGRTAVLSKHNAACMAQETTDLLNRFL
jgi:glycosyltransferase involved in cell wall biosynthesis